MRYGDGRLMSSFRRIDKDIDYVANAVEVDVITLAENSGEVIKLHGKRYRKANFSTQDWIYHWISDLKGIKKVYIRGHNGGWYSECVKHKCTMNCKGCKHLSRFHIKCLYVPLVYREIIPLLRFLSISQDRESTLDDTECSLTILPYMLMTYSLF